MDPASSLAIVAIPRADDEVWKLSSEKVPHLTILFLGDQSKNPNVDRIVEHLEFVAKTSLEPFGLQTDHRGVLGDKDADVLFFGRYFTKQLEEFRTYLLKNHYIAEAYNSTEQYPNWTPHLTLGYPESPAKSIEGDRPYRWISFDRIALWTGDYEGPEFRLEHDEHSEELRMSVADSDAISHFGVKGMQWGVRKDESGGYNLQASGPNISADLHPATKVAGKDVANLISKRYGFQITDVKTIKPSDPTYFEGQIGFVQSTPGKRGGVIHVSGGDIRKPLKDAEKAGFFADGCGHPHSALTHESAHAIFHAEMKTQKGLLGSKVVGGDIKARDKALNVALKAAKKDGIPNHLFASKTSGYADAAGNREELEAELFTQYHWGKNPPRFVNEWGKTLHKEMGIDDTPFREEVRIE